MAPVPIVWSLRKHRERNAPLCFSSSDRFMSPLRPCQAKIIYHLSQNDFFKMKGFLLCLMVRLMFSFFRAIVLHKEAVSVAAFFLHCLTLFFPYLGTLCSCERTHVRSDILLASPPQCPLPFLPLAPFLCFTALSCLSLPSTPVFPLRPPCLFPFSPLAAHSLVTPISHFHLILHSLSLFPLRL